MELAGIGIYRYALDGTVLHMDPGALLVLELAEAFPDPTAVVGRNIRDLFRYVETPRSLRARVREEGRVKGVEYAFETLSGRRKWCIHDAFLVRDEATGLEAIQVISRDITELKTAQVRLEEANRELAAANAQLRTLDELKSNLLANVSHELRSPLVTVRGYADLIRTGHSGRVNETQRRQLEVMVHNVDRLAALIDDLLQAARASGGGAALNVSSGDLNGLLEAVLASLEPKRRAKDVRLETALHPGPLLLEGDLRLLSQVAVNLLDNALKFTPAGGRVRVATAPEDPAHLRFEVTDTGIGIAAEHQARIFERFFQVDSSSTRSFTGLGLGLAISRDVVRLHGGTLTVESAPGAGSTFRVRLPRTCPR
jgi:signal transduction histidine kinase